MRGQEAGLWIDPKQAVVVIITGGEEEIRRIESSVEKHVRYSGSAHSKTPYGPEGEEDKRDRRFAGHLRRYYDEVISCIRDAESILIFGPGEAKVIV